MKIKFLKDHVNKEKGNIHDFEKGLAKKLIKDGIAEEVKSKGRPKTKK